MFVQLTNNNNDNNNGECVTIGPCEGEATTSNSPSLFHWDHFGEEHT